MQKSAKVQCGYLHSIDVSVKDCPLTLHVNGKNHHLNSVYWYQSGEIIEEASIQKNIQSSELLHFAPGIQRSSVATINGKKAILRGNFPVNDRLEIL